MKRVKNKPINLLPLDGFETSTFGRIVKWALSTFRVMVIATELIVMSAFLSRFWLDARNSDLNEEIEIDKAQILAYSDIESDLRSFQKRLVITKSLFTENKNSDLLSYLSKAVPTDVSLNSFSTSSDGFVIKANSFSEKSIAQLMANLEENDKYESVILSQISSNPEDINLITFTITGKGK